MPSENDRIVGRVLREVRERIGIRQADLAGRLGLPQSYISKVETGARALKLSEVFGYASALGIDVHILLAEVAAAVTAD